jgi:outer membrane protein assembly factor BamB
MVEKNRLSTIGLYMKIRNSLLRYFLAVTFLISWMLVNASAAQDGQTEILPPDLGTRDFGQDWPAFLGPEGNSVSREPVRSFDWPSGRPPIVWQTTLGTSYSSPSISRGRLFHFDRYGDQNRLVCRNAETGQLLWSYEYATDYEDMLGYNNGPRATPVVDGNRVYIVGSEGQLHALRVTDGELLWKVDTMTRFGVVKNFFGVGSTPLVWRDLLIVHIGGSPAGSPPDIYTARGNVRGNGTCIVAFDKFTGTVRYQISDELASYSSPLMATIDGRPWCFQFARGGLIGFQPGTGQVEFRYPWKAKKLESVNAAMPVVAGNEVFISEAYGPGSSLLAVQPGGVAVVWADKLRKREKSLKAHWCTPILHEGYLYGCHGYQGTNELRCVEWKTGQVKWTQTDFHHASILFVSGKLLVINEEGILRVVQPNPEEYQLVTQFELHDDNGHPLLRKPCWVAPVLSHGLLYLRGKDRLVCLELVVK